MKDRAGEEVISTQFKAVKRQGSRHSGKLCGVGLWYFTPLFWAEGDGHDPAASSFDHHDDGQIGH